jgi:hypothetical protein
MSPKNRVFLGVRNEIEPGELVGSGERDRFDFVRIEDERAEIDVAREDEDLARNQKSEIRNQKPEIRNQRLELNAFLRFRFQVSGFWFFLISDFRFLISDLLHHGT